MNQTGRYLFGAVVGATLAGGLVMLADTSFANAPVAALTDRTSRVSPVTAMKTAEHKVGGFAKMATFEFEDRHWIYGVMVVKDHKLFEVEIDANTGKLGDVESASADGEAKELKAELTKMGASGK